MMYIVLTGFFFFANLLFINSLDSFDELCKRLAADMIAFKLNALDINSMVLSIQFINIAFICLFFLPIMTMKLISDEKKSLLDLGSVTK